MMSAGDPIGPKFIPPPAEALEALGSIAGVRFTPGTVTGQVGPEGRFGPEAAGALLILHFTSVDEDATRRFWEVNLPVIRALSMAPGFIRRFSCVEGPNVYLVAFWKTEQDAKAFIRSAEHKAAVKALYNERILYSHFVGMWTAASVHSRLIFCPSCGQATPVPTDTCSGCGVALIDVFAATEPPATSASHPRAMGTDRSDLPSRRTSAAAGKAISSSPPAMTRSSGVYKRSRPRLREGSDGARPAVPLGCGHRARLSAQADAISSTCCSSQTARDNKCCSQCGPRCPAASAIVQQL